MSAADRAREILALTAVLDSGMAMTPRNALHGSPYWSPGQVPIKQRQRNNRKNNQRRAKLRKLRREQVKAGMR